MFCEYILQISLLWMPEMKKMSKLFFSSENATKAKINNEKDERIYSKSASTVVVVAEL